MCLGLLDTFFISSCTQIVGILCIPIKSECDTNNILAPESFKRYSILSFGYSGKIGRYVPPAFKIPYIEIIISNERCARIPITSPDCTPLSIKL